MKIHSYALSIVLGACTFSLWTNAFLHSPPRTSVLSLKNNCRTSGHVQRRRTSLSEGEGSADDFSLISALAFYPSDESLSERLKNVQAEWNNVKKEGIAKFFSDELEAAEKILRGNADRAERGAKDVIEKGESEDYLLKEGFHGMVDTGKMLASEMKEVRQEFDELKATKLVEKAAEDVVETTVLVEKELEKVVESVVASLQEAEEAVQSAIAAVTSKEGLTDAVKADLTAKLEAKAQNIEESVRVADSVAKTARQIAVEDEKVMSELENTGDRLSDAIDATESLTETLRGTEGGAAVDAVSKTVDQTAAIVREDLSAAESIAEVVSQKVVMEADAVMAMDEKATGSVEAIRAAKSSIRDSSSEDDSESLTSALTKDAQDIKTDEDSAEKLAAAIKKDAANDEEALEVLERSSSEVNSLIDAVDDAVDKAEEVTTGDASVASVTEAVDQIENEVKEVEESMADVEDATEKCEDCQLKKLIEETEAENKASSSATVDEGNVVKMEGESTSRVEDEVKEDITKEKQELKANNGSGVKDTADNEKDTLSAQGELAGEDSNSVGDELAVQIPEATAVTSADNDGESLGNAVTGTADGAQHGSDSSVDAVRAASDLIDGGDVADAMASANPAEGLANVMTGAVESVTDSIGSGAVADAMASAEPSEGLGNDMADAAESAMSSIGSGDVADAMTSAEPLEGSENVLASKGNVASEVINSISSSNTVHDVITSTTETLAEVVTVMSSLIL
eukprot:CAMPEP_0172538826 /NCGR_PEP_ID=MMETSP1067-20121228/10138_1 /TAXON_ID=265564 ORGANISM="Thalassiosira punctigera, Strain Tpunct2005C2" /NCGR_SAMPLE_ID=MMETSP1067 /ASSEMBLY_ACC=CAM_ASM_000444 /LENGTH=742 /DNA_ID=CAMNT_0013324401 /DNA_START=25 /DNA_END=2253 /DNA_ORIENTATION=-